MTHTDTKTHRQTFQHIDLTDLEASRPEIPCHSPRSVLNLPSLPVSLHHEVTPPSYFCSPCFHQKSTVKDRFKPLVNDLQPKLKEKNNFKKERQVGRKLGILEETGPQHVNSGRQKI